MPGGLVALLDDVAIIARAAATSIDDVSVAASKAGTKAAGVVIDDAAVTPSYVTGLSPARELPIIWEITQGSLRNKLLILLPAALLLSEFFPWAILPILMMGGAYLSYEGAEKVLEKLGGEKHGQTLGDDIADPAKFEEMRITGAIRTDLILSAEIMAITLSEVSAETLIVRAGVLALVGVVITIAVYGVVALIVKMDDIGLHLVKRESSSAQRLGDLLVHAMPKLLTILSIVGTIAMLWVGGGIILHGMHELGLGQMYDAIHSAEHVIAQAAGTLGGIIGWISFAALSALFGLALGTILALVLHKLFRFGEAKVEAGA